MEQVSNSSLSALDIIEEPSIQSNDAAMVAAKALGWRGFDASKAAPDDVQTQAAIRLRGKLRSKELAQLRQLVEGDERFARLLDRHCKAVHELIVLGNPAPVLAVLAGLVWSSLSIAWELDTSHMPKARMKNEIDQLKVKLQKVLDDFSESRACYLKEIVAQRDKLRRFDALHAQEVERLVYEEEPVMFYEPIKYLDDKTRGHVAEIIEEKLKLLLKRLEMGDAPIDWQTFMTAASGSEENIGGLASPRSPAWAKKPRSMTESAKDDLEFGAKAEQAVRRECERAAAEELRKAQASFRAQLEELRTSKKALEGEMSQRLEESEARHAKTQMMVAEYKAQHLQTQAELSSISAAMQKEFQELAQLPGGSPSPEFDQASGLALQLLLRMEGEVRATLQAQLKEAEERPRRSSEDGHGKEVLLAPPQEGAAMTGLSGARPHREASKSSARLGSKEVGKAATVDRGEGPSRAGSKVPATTAEKAVGTASRAGSKVTSITTADKSEGPASRAGSKVAAIATANKEEGTASRAGSKVPSAASDKADGNASRAASKVSRTTSGDKAEGTTTGPESKESSGTIANMAEGTASRAGSKVALDISADFAVGSRSRAGSKAEVLVSQEEWERAASKASARTAPSAPQGEPEVPLGAMPDSAKGMASHAGSDSGSRAGSKVRDAFAGQACEQQRASSVLQAASPPSDPSSAFLTQEVANDVMMLQAEEIISAAAFAEKMETPNEAVPDSRAAESMAAATEFVTEEVGRLGDENRSLRSEVQRLQQALGELASHIQQLESSPAGRPKSGYGSAVARALKLPITGLNAGKVHERLYLEFYDRQERKRALQESVQQARENEVLDIFKSQHPWLNALSKHSEAMSFLSAYTEGLSSEEDKIVSASELWRTHAEVESAWREQLETRYTRPPSWPPQRQVPSPRSPASEGPISPVAAPTSPHLAANYYPLIISRLAGDTTPARSSSERPSPSSGTRPGSSSKLKRPKSSGALSHSSSTGRKPSAARQETGHLDSRKIREGLSLLASKPGEAKVPAFGEIRSSSATALMRRPSVRCLL